MYDSSLYTLENNQIGKIYDRKWFEFAVKDVGNQSYCL